MKVEDLVKEQTPPRPNNGVAIWDCVVEDVEECQETMRLVWSDKVVNETITLMKQRNLEGVEKYGTPLQAYNGRDPIVDALQELLDATVYLKQACIERVTGPSVDDIYNTRELECLYEKVRSNLIDMVWLMSNLEAEKQG